MSAPKMKMMEVLIRAGFGVPKPDPRRVPGGLAYNMGDFVLFANQYHSIRCFREVVAVSGVRSTPNTIENIYSDLPLEVDSYEEGLAYLAMSLDGYSPGKFKTTIPIPWLEEGRKHFDLLPWRKERLEQERLQAIRRARPQCHVPKAWAKLALKEIESAALAAADDTAFLFDFDGRVLRVFCPHEICAIPGTGSAWASCVAVAASSLRSLPKRLYGPETCFSLWESCLEIDGSKFEQLPISGDTK